MNTSVDLAHLNELATAAMGENGLITVMGKKGALVQRDIPAAFEMFSLLSIYLGKLPVLMTPLGEGAAEVLLEASIIYDKDNQRVLALIPVGPKELGYIAHWVVDSLRSETVLAMPGILALPFSIENHEETELLIPEWFAAFYADGNEDHCIPMLVLNSVTEDQRFSDWVSVALERMPVFGLPCSQAASAIKTMQNRPSNL